MVRERERERESQHHCLFNHNSTADLDYQFHPLSRGTVTLEEVSSILSISYFSLWCLCMSKGMSECACMYVHVCVCVCVCVCVHHVTI